MSSILSRTISSLLDKRVVLSNSQFARRLPFGTTWQSIRIGIRISMRDTGADLASNPRFWFGVCSGSTNLVSDATTTNFCGCATNATTWGRNATRYNKLSAGIVCATRVGSTNTFSTGANVISGSSLIQNGAALNAADRTLWFIQITKGSPNYTYRGFFCQTDGAADRSHTEMLEQMEQVTPSLTGHAWSNAVVLATSEAAGTFDHVNISWERTYPEMEISDLVVTRFS